MCAVIGKNESRIPLVTKTFFAGLGVEQVRLRSKTSLRADKIAAAANKLASRKVSKYTLLCSRELTFLLLPSSSLTAASRICPQTSFLRKHQHPRPYHKRTLTPICPVNCWICHYLRVAEQVTKLALQDKFGESIAAAVSMAQPSGEPVEEYEYVSTYE